MAKTYTTTAWLRPYKSKQGQQVFIRVRTRDGFETEIPVYDYVNNSKLPISIKKEYWSKGTITGGSYHISLRAINNLIANVEYRVKDAVSELLEKKAPISRENIIRLAYINQDNEVIDEKNIASGKVIVNDDGGAFASQDEFEEFIADSSDPKYAKIKKALGITQKEYILDYWDDYITNYAPDSYNCSKHSIVEYIEKTGDNCKAVDFSDLWLKRFFTYIIENGFSIQKDGKNRKDYSTSTINKYLKHQKLFGKYLFSEVKVINNQEYGRFMLHDTSKKKSLLKFKPDPYINTHALSKKQFDYFLRFKFDDKQLDIARDMFVLQTWLGGLRQSDLYSLTPDNIIKDSNSEYTVSFQQQKTKDIVINALNINYLASIFEKYPNRMPTFHKVHVYNKLLKAAAEKAGLDQKLMFRNEKAKEGSPTTEFFKIHEKISNKWARNCVVSILAELGYPDDNIAVITGHKDKEMINHYKQFHKPKIRMMLDEVKPEIVEKL
jgi:integrase